MKFKILALATASLLAIAPAGVRASAQSPSTAIGATIPRRWTARSSPATILGLCERHVGQESQIAADRASADRFVTLSDEIEKDVREIVERSRQRSQPRPLGQQVGDFYASYMDEAAIEAAGTAPLKPYLAKIAAVEDPRPAARLFVKPGFASPVDVEINPELKDPTRYSAIASQARLGMPSREYYLARTPR